MSEANNKVLRFWPNFNSVAKSRGSYIPDLTLPPETVNRPIGVWGRRHRDYLKNHRKAIYSIMLMDNTLHMELLPTILFQKKTQIKKQFAYIHLRKVLNIDVVF